MRGLRRSMLAAVRPVPISSASPPRVNRRTPINSPPKRTDLPSPSERAELKRGTAQSSYFPTELAEERRGPTIPGPSQALRMRDVNPTLRGGGSDDTVWEILSDEDKPRLEITEAGTLKSKAATRDVKTGAKSIKARATKGQSKIQGTKVTKPKATTREPGRNNSRDATKKVSRDEPLGLEMVLPRRRDWTPVKSRSTSFVNIDDLVETSTTGDIEELGEQGDSQTKSFRGILGGFQFETSPSAVVAKQQRMSSVQPPLKKRKLDLVEATVGVRPIATTAKKAKAPKKKARTITDQATREFMPVDDVLNKSTSLLENFLTPASDNHSTDPEKEAAQMTNALNRGLKLSKSTKLKATGQPAAKLLSPERAIQATESQELLFGTSSQLVREDSPTFIRDLQNALKDSETSASQQRSKLDTPQPVSGSKGLWAAATRNTDGTLMAAETIDLAKTPQPIAIHARSNGAFEATTPLLAPTRSAPAEQPIELADGTPASDLQSASIAHLDETHPISLPRSVAEAACKSRPRSKSPTKKTKPRTSDVAKVPSKTSKAGRAKGKVKDKSDFNTWTVAELTKQIKSYGFKPVKGKSAMVALLQKCAASMTERQAPEETRPAQTAEEVKSPHFAPVDDVLVDNDVTPKAKAKSKAKSKLKTKDKEKDVGAPDNTAPEIPIPLPSSPTRPARAKSTKKRNAAAASTTAIEESEMLSAITRAVTTFPPTHDMKNLTWHEKMLLYDPIVLEDLTTWLNTVGLGRVDFDEEVWPGLVRTWCEKYSICCVWKENLRGGKRARY